MLRGITAKNWETHLLEDEAQQNPENLGKLQVNKENLLLSFHSKNPSQKNDDLKKRKGKECCSVY